MKVPSTMNLPASHPDVAAERIGVLLVNLGTPDAPTAPAVRRYLAEFLSDPRVIEIPKLAWQPILHGIILRTRPAKSAHAYAQVWTDEGSPLAAITAAQARELQPMLEGGVDVQWAMRYGNPGIESRLAQMQAAGCRRILIAPLYPQYCAATTASVMDKVAQALKGMRWQPALRTLPPYYDDDAYIGALADDLERQLRELPSLPETLVLSFHGMPQRTLELGDPYHCHCQKTARLLEARLTARFTGLTVTVSFQSRFGRAKWLEPSTETVLADLGRNGVRCVAIAAPGFAADCVETLEELAIRGREVFESVGGETFVTLSCLNASDAGMKMLHSLVEKELSGWVS